jgi:hypothetical protein
MSGGAHVNHGFVKSRKSEYGTRVELETLRLRNWCTDHYIATFGCQKIQDVGKMKTSNIGYVIPQRNLSSKLSED